MSVCLFQSIERVLKLELGLRSVKSHKTVINAASINTYVIHSLLFSR